MEARPSGELPFDNNQVAILAIYIIKNKHLLSPGGVQRIEIAWAFRAVLLLWPCSIDRRCTQQFLPFSSNPCLHHIPIELQLHQH